MIRGALVRIKKRMANAAMRTGTAGRTMISSAERSMADTASRMSRVDGDAQRALRAATDHGPGSTITLIGRPGVAALLPIRDLMNRSERDVRKRLRRALDGKYGKPGRQLDLEITQVIKERSDCLNVTGLVRNEYGVGVGKLQRRWYVNQEGTLMVDDLPTGLRLGVQFTGDLGRTLTDYYRRSGVHSIRIHAADNGATEFSRLGARWSSEPADVALNSHMVRHEISTLLQFKPLQYNPHLSAADASTLHQLHMKFGLDNPNLWPPLSELVDPQGEYSRFGRRIVQNLPLYLQQRL